MTELRKLALAEIVSNTGQIDGVKANPRFIRDKYYKRLVRSLRKSDLTDIIPLKVYPWQGQYVTIGGNMRLRALQEIGVTEVSCIVISADTPAEVLNKAVILDNSTYGEWDWDMLANEWSGESLEDWGLDVPTSWGGSEEEAQEDDFDEEKDKVETVCKKGDIWQLGNHRLMCGSCTDEEAMNALMNGERADIAFTSPPYNMMASNISAAFKSDKVEDTYGIENGTYQEFNDNLSNEDYAKLLNDALDNCLAHSDEVLFNIGILKGSKEGILEMLYKHSKQFADLLVWNKNTCMPLCLPTQLHMLNHICEPIFCFNHEGDMTFSHSQWKLGMMHNRIDTKKASGNEYSKVHHATFPVELPHYIVQNFSKNSVLDCFGGTGTTMIAAEYLGRKCYMMELDPHYCDVIIARWEKMTNNRAIKL